MEANEVDDEYVPLVTKDMLNADSRCIISSGREKKEARHYAIYFEAHREFEKQKKAVDGQPL